MVKKQNNLKFQGSRSWGEGAILSTLEGGPGGASSKLCFMLTRFLIFYKIRLREGSKNKQFKLSGFP